MQVALSDRVTRRDCDYDLRKFDDVEGVVQGSQGGWVVNLCKDVTALARRPLRDNGRHARFESHQQE